MEGIVEIQYLFLLGRLVQVLRKECWYQGDGLFGKILVYKYEDFWYIFKVLVFINLIIEVLGY